MRQWRLRRLVTRRRLKWAWVPIAASVLVVAVAMACAVWSPVQEVWSSFGRAPFGRENGPRALRRYHLDYMHGFETTGFGVSFYYIPVIEFSQDASNPWWRTLDFTVGRAGLPFRCLRFADDTSGSFVQPSLWARGIEASPTIGEMNLPRRVPLMPEPVGMLLNILIVSAAIALVRVGLRRAVVYRRRRKSLCVNCAYPVDDFTVCPECGKATGCEA